MGLSFINKPLLDFSLSSLPVGMEESAQLNFTLEADQRGLVYEITHYYLITTIS